MSKQEDKIQVTLQQLQHMKNALSALQKEKERYSKEWFDLLTEGPIHEIKVLKRELDSLLKCTKLLYIVRGLPGSGKSTLAKTLAPEAQVLSTDDFFVTKSGKYEFNGKYISRAHEWNKFRTQALMSTGVSPIVVDNTHTQAWEYEAYIDLAETFGYNIEVRLPDTPWAFNVDECTARTVHNVPREVIQKMADRFEKRPTC